MSFHGAMPATQYYVQAAILQGWQAWFASNLANFKSIFRGIDPAVLTAWHTALTERKPDDPQDEPLLQVRVHGQAGIPRFPGIVVLLESESLEDDPIGMANLIGDERVEPAILRQMVTIEVRAPGAEIAWALTVVVRAILASIRRELLREGNYLDIQFLSCTGPSPEEAMLQEATLGAVSVQTLRYSITQGYSFPTLGGEPALSIDWVVQRDDVPIDDQGNLGGVVALDG